MEGFLTPQMSVYITGFLFFILLIVGIVIIISQQKKTSTPANVKQIQSTEFAAIQSRLAPLQRSKEPLFSTKVKPDERLLVNYAPLTIYDPAYIGPFTDGVYQEREGVTAALQAGARCFVLPIDYHEDSSLQPPLFAAANQPCLLYRDGGNVIRSLNSGSIEKVAQAIADIGFSENLSNKDDPIVLILYFLRTPAPQTKEYLRYCSEVAKQLNPLLPYLLSQAPEGVYNRQARQNEILYTDIQTIEKKLLVFCNIDLSLFRTPQTVNLPAFPPKFDLDYWVHLRLFKQTEEALGATSSATQNEFARGYIGRTSYFTLLPESRVKETQDSAKIRWMVAVSPPGETVSKADTQLLLDRGVQSIALPLASPDTSAMELWKTQGWRLKPARIRFTRPRPFVPASPSPKLNAMGGNLTAPTF